MPTIKTPSSAPPTTRSPRNSGRRSSSYRRVPSPDEVQSWQNSLRATAMVFQEAEPNDHALILECQLPLSSRRLDCIVTGHDRAASANAVITELKRS